VVEEGRGNDFVSDSIDGWIKYTNVRFVLYNRCNNLVYL